MNYFEEQTDGEAVINSIKNGDQPLTRVTQVLIARTSSTEQPPLKDKLVCNKTAKDLWDALARNMIGSEYGEQDRKAVVLYEYETFKATKGELFLDTYIQYLQVINDLKKSGYSKDNCVLNFKFLNNLQPEWKKYTTMMRHNKNLMDINIEALYNILKQNQGNTLRYQDLEWYDALKDSELKEEALINKAIMEGLIDEDVEPNNEGWKSWDDFENTNGNRKERRWEYEHEDKERCELFNNHELPVCIVRRF
nr:hypothetical protein [Tanacetum cinerariifolium]